MGGILRLMEVYAILIFLGAFIGFFRKTEMSEMAMIASRGRRFALTLLTATLFGLYLWLAHGWDPGLVAGSHGAFYFFLYGFTMGKEGRFYTPWVLLTPSFYRYRR